MSRSRIVAVVAVVVVLAHGVAEATQRLSGDRRIVLRRSDRSTQNRLAFVRAARAHHQLLADRALRNDDIDIGLVDSVIHEFLAEIEIGEPGQPVQVVFDTGSSEIWLSSSLCQDDTCDLEDQRFDPDLSSTFCGSDRRESCEYGSGQVSGPIGHDQIEISPGVLVRHQSMGLIESQDGSVFEAGVLDGIIGMSLRGLSSYTTDDDFMENLPLIYNMRDQDLLPGGQFSFYFSMDETQRPSQLMFGVADSSLFVGRMRWIPVVGNAFWAVPITKLTIGGKPYSECSDYDPCYGILDSGSTAFTAPTTFMEQMVTSFEPGTRVRDLPSVSFTIAGVEYTIDGHEYVICEESECSPGWTAMDFPEVDAFILGDMFLSKYFTVFDLDKHRVGLAPVAPLNEDPYQRKMLRKLRLP